MVELYRFSSFRKSCPGLVSLVLVLVFFCFSGKLAVASEEVSSQIVGKYLETVADRLYNTKEIEGNLELALEYYKMAMNQRPGTPGIEWKIARCYWVLAEKATDEQELQLYYKEGTRYGKLAVKNDTSNSNAHLWNSLIVGSSAMRQGVVKTLYNREVIKSGLLKALELDPENTNAYVGLAGWYFHVPAIFGGDKSQAFQLLDKAIKLEPNYTAAWLVKAEFLIREKEFEQAVQTLNKLLSIENPVIRGDGVEDKKKAANLLATLKSSQLNG